MIKKIMVGAFLFCAMYSAQSQNWLTNFEEAKKLSSQTNKHIILVFQGSDWCAPCMKLEKEIFESPEFIKYSDEHFIMVKADFPKKEKNKLSDSQQLHNNQLMEKYNKSGYFPFVTILDKETKILGSTGYKKITPTEYIKILTSF